MRRWLGSWASQAHRQGQGHARHQAPGLQSHSALATPFSGRKGYQACFRGGMQSGLVPDLSSNPGHVCEVLFSGWLWLLSTAPMLSK